MPDLRTLELHELAHAVNNSGVALTDTSPFAALDLEHHPRPATKLEPVFLDSVRVLCAPERRLTLFDQVSGQRHTFFTRGSQAAQLLWSEELVVVGRPMPSDHLRHALALKATSSEATEPVAISLALLTGLATLFRSKGQLVERRARAEANTLFADPQVVDEVLAFGAATVSGRELVLAAPFRSILAALFSGEFIGVERVLIEGNQFGERFFAGLTGPAGRRISVTDVTVLDREASLFVSLDAEHAGRWASHFVR